MTPKLKSCAPTTLCNPPHITFHPHSSARTSSPPFNTFPICISRISWERDPASARWSAGQTSRVPRTGAVRRSGKELPSSKSKDVPRSSILCIYCESCNLLKSMFVLVDSNFDFEFLSIKCVDDFCSLNS